MRSQSPWRKDRKEGGKEFGGVGGTLVRRAPGSTMWRDLCTFPQRSHGGRDRSEDVGSPVWTDLGVRDSRRDRRTMVERTDSGIEWTRTRWGGGVRRTGGDGRSSERKGTSQTSSTSLPGFVRSGLFEGLNLGSPSLLLWLNR